MQAKFLVIASAAVLLTMCSGPAEEKKEGSTPKETKRVVPHPKDVHTFSNYEKAYCTHLFLDITILFELQQYICVLDF